MLGALRNIKVMKVKGLSDAANEFDSYLKREETWRSAGTYIPSIRMSYDTGDVIRMERNYISRLTKGKTKLFSPEVVAEYITYAKANVEPKTWVYNRVAHIDRINQLQRSIAYYRALVELSKK